MATGFLARNMDWVAICAIAGTVAFIAYNQAQVLKEATTAVSSVGQLAEPFILFGVFWAAIGVLALSAVQLFRK